MEIILVLAGQAPPYLYADYKSEAKHWRVHVDAGPFVGFLVSATQVTSGTSLFFLEAAGRSPITPAPQSLDASEDIKDQLRRINVGIEGGIGLTWRNGHHGVTVEGGRRRIHLLAGQFGGLVVSLVSTFLSVALAEKRVVRTSASITTFDR